jgi:hypothetical protein
LVRSNQADAARITAPLKPGESDDIQPRRISVLRLTTLWLFFSMREKATRLATSNIPSFNLKRLNIVSTRARVSCWHIGCDELRQLPFRVSLSAY